MKSWFLIPPVAFSITLLVVLLLSRSMKRAAFRGTHGPGAENAYSCGENMEENKFRPEYGQFFSFAFFFTIMHVVALVVATIPSGVPGYYFISALYLVGALIGLTTLLRKEK
jgi:NADH-quinone oxidoreductase subunit A